MSGSVVVGALYTWGDVLTCLVLLESFSRLIFQYYI